MVRLKEKQYKFLSIFAIVAIMMVLILKIGLKSIPIQGEVDSYILPTVSVEDRGTIIINELDIEQAKIDFPNLYNNVNCYEDLRASKLLQINTGQWISWYFPTYSISCLPVKLFLKSLHFDQSYTFLYSNVLYFIISLLCILFKLKTTYRKKLYIILLLICNPILFYIIGWISDESFIFSLVVISLVFFSNKEYKKSALFVSLAGSLNPTIMVMGFMFIVSYFINIYKKNKDLNFSQIIKENLKNTIYFGICFIPSIVPFIFNYCMIGKVNASITMMASSENLFDRFFSYLFDLNLGILPYFPILFLVFIISSIYGLYRMDIDTIIYLISFYGTILAYSVANHINSGMTSVARYSSWISPIMIFFVVMIGVDFIKKEYIVKGIISTSSIITLCIMLSLFASKQGRSYTYHTPITTFILDNIPQAYNPFYATFISRTEHIDGGYKYEKPIIYTDKNGIVRKVLYTDNTVYILKDMLVGSKADLEKVFEKVSNNKSTNKYKYINISSLEKINVLKNEENNKLDGNFK